VTVSDATYTANAGNANAVSLAPQLVVSAGVSARHPIGLFGSVRLRAVGDRPATEDRSLTAEGFAILSAQLGYRRGWWELAVQAENLLDSTWREAQFANESRLRNECLTAAPGCAPPADGRRFGTVSDVHFTPGTPFAAQARLTLYLR
jgi:outer membrane receptor protein involved in Fe transport